MLDTSYLHSHVRQLFLNKTEKKIEQSIEDLQKNIKWFNRYVTGILEGKESKQNKCLKT